MEEHQRTLDRVNAFYEGRIAMGRSPFAAFLDTAMEFNEPWLWE